MKNHVLIILELFKSLPLHKVKRINTNIHNEGNETHMSVKFEFPIISRVLAYYAV